MKYEYISMNRIVLSACTSLASSIRNQPLDDARIETCLTRMVTNNVFLDGKEKVIKQYSDTVL
jgi:uncharacterized protein (DUF2252 family)